jgi:hypothetical protein
MTFKGREVVTVVQNPEAVEKVQWFQTAIVLPVLGTLILTMDLLSKHFWNCDKINCYYVLDYFGVNGIQVVSTSEFH